VPSLAEDAPFEVVNGNELPDAPRAIEPERPTVSVSEADESAEVITEQWRLAAAEDRPAATPALLAREEEPPPRFELGEPGTGLEETNVDMPPDVALAFEMGEPIPEAEPEPPADIPAPPALEVAMPIEAAPPAPPPAPAFPEVAEVPAPAPEPELEAEPEPLPEALALDQTRRISPEDLEAALGGPPAPVPEAPPWEPPVELEGTIASFNARHAVLFRALRAEVGAGAANFVRSCRGALGDSLGSLFASVELRADGSWDPDGLRRAISERQVGDPAEGFQRLLEQEVELLRVHLGEKRVSSLVEQLAAIS
jgi:hypothetical protein